MTRHPDRAVGAVLACLLAAAPAAGQWVPVRRYTVTDGLAQSQVTALVLDRAGFLWIGTQGGLSRFDGLRFRTYTIAEGLPDDVVTALAPGRGRDLWVGTDSGWVARVGPDGIEPVGRVSAGRPVPVTALATLPGGEVLASGPAGVVRVGRGPSRVLLPDPAAAVAGAGSGAVALAGSRLLALPHRTGLGAVPGPPLVWAPARDGLLVAGAGWAAHAGEDGLREVIRVAVTGRPTAVAPASGGGLWLAAGREVWHLPPRGAPRRLALRPATVRADVTALLDDTAGGLWAGTWGQGLLAIRPRGIWSLTPDSGLPSPTVWGFARTGDGCVWMATEDAGLASWCGARWGRRWTAGDGLPSDATTAVLATPDGALWVGTTEGLGRIGPQGRVTSWTEADGLPHRFVRALARAPDGTVWAATSGGIAAWDGSRWRALGPGEGIVGAPVRGIAVAVDGTVWAATHAAGVLRWDGSRVTRFGLGEGLPHERVWTLRLDSRGRVWAGTDAGVWIHAPSSGTHRTVTVADGLPNPNVLFLVEDGAGRMWAGTTRGVAVLSPEGRVLRVLTATDGLTHAEAAENAAFRDADGRLWLGMAEGVTVVDPATVLGPVHRPRPVLERVLVGGRPVPFPADGTISVPPGVTDVRIEVTAPTLHAPHGVRFRYRLDRLDPTWSPPTDEPHVTYRHLPPGRYRLLVRAERDTDPEPGPVLGLDLVVLPPWYRTWWSRLGAVLAVLGAAWGLARWRMAAHERRRRELEREVALRTAELAAANRRIREQNRRLEELSRTDPLTGLANRRVIEEVLPVELALAQRQTGRTVDVRGVAVLLLDLDGFKEINDRLGHEAGDRLLRRLAAAVTGTIRDVDVACRWGGDELLVLARAVTAGETAALAGRLLEAVAGPPPPGEPRLSVSIGFVPYPLAAEGPLPREHWGLLVQVADRLLYAAKRRGRGRAVGLCRRGAVGAPEVAVVQALLERPEAPPAGLELVEVPSADG